MAIQIDDIEPRRSYDVGGTPQAAFTIPFPFFDAADIRCSVGGVELESGFGVTGAGESSGGTLTLTAPVSNTVVTIWRDVAIKRMSNYPAGGPFRTDVLNAELSKAVAVSQQLADRLQRSIRIPDAERTADTAIPSAAIRARKSLIFDDDGNVAVSTFDHEEQAQFPVQAAASAAQAAAAKTDAEQARDQAATIKEQTAAIALGDFVQVGLGAVPRPTSDKLRDTLNVRDFGAVLDGVADDTAALAAAVAAADATIAIIIDGPMFLGSPQSISVPTGNVLEFRGVGRLIWNFGALQSVAIEDGGRGYTSIPLVSVGGDAVLGAVTMETCPVEQLLPRYYASAVSVTAGGSGYAVGDIVSVVGGYYNNLGPASLEVTTVSAGAVTAAKIVGQGGYMAVPGASSGVTAVTGSGSGAAVTLTTSLGLAVVIATGGSGYVVGDTLTVPGSGTPATLTVSSVSGGAVTAVTIATPGAYTTPPGTSDTYATPDLHCVVSTTGGTGTGCSVIVTTTAMDAGIIAKGSGYTAGDILTVSGGTGTAATFRADVVDGAGGLLTVKAINHGAYTALPSSSASVTGGTGAGATLTLHYGIKSVAVTSGGSYTSIPTVSVAGGGTPRWQARLTPVGRKPTLNCTIQAAERQIFEGYKRFNGELAPLKGSVRWFGAVGDMSTDDTDAIQAAIDGLIEVVFPPGAYMADGTIFGRPFRKLRGAGRTPNDGGYAQYGTQIRFRGSAAAGMDSDPSKWLPEFEIRDMTVSSAGARGAVVRLNNPANCVIRNVTIGSGPSGSGMVLRNTQQNIYSHDTASYPCWINHVVDSIVGSATGWSLVNDGITDSRFVNVYTSGGRGVLEYGANNIWSSGMTDNATDALFAIRQRSLTQRAKHVSFTSYALQKMSGPALATGISIIGMDGGNPIDAHVVIGNCIFNNLPATQHIFFQNAKRMVFSGNSHDYSAKTFGSAGTYDNYVVTGNLLMRSVPGATGNAVVANNIR